MEVRRYRDVRAAVLRALATGNYRHETRSGRVDEKNWLQVDLVSETFVLDAIKSFPAGKAKGTDHHYLSGVVVWTVMPTVRETGGIVRVWYIKFYCIDEDDTWFISVHPSSES